MKKRIVIFLIFLILLFHQLVFSDNIIIYTANVSWFSRIYKLNMDGSFIDFFEYDYYILNDVEVVNNEVYITDWIAPCLLKLNYESGDFDVIVDDISLLSMYDVAWDGTYFYIDEWRLNRYDIDGYKCGNISFSENLRGSTWDGNYYWTLNDESEIKCWDISNWPDIIEISANNFSPPTNSCRGLWFDGEYFWTAEHMDITGYIYQFDYSGSVVNQWTEPCSGGYAACFIEDTTSSLNPQDEQITNKNICYPNYPEPVKNYTNFKFYIPTPEKVSLNLFDVKGNKIDEIEDKFFNKGINIIKYNTNEYKNGLYIYEIKIGKKKFPGKLIIMN